MTDRRRAVVARLWDRCRIIATPIVHAEYEGVRITPNVYTTLEEIDTFESAMEEIAAKRCTRLRRSFRLKRRKLRPGGSYDPVPIGFPSAS